MVLRSMGLKNNPLILWIGSGLISLGMIAFVTLEIRTGHVRATSDAVESAQYLLGALERNLGHRFAAIEEFLLKLGAQPVLRPPLPGDYSKLLNEQRPGPLESNTLFVLNSQAEILGFAGDRDKIPPLPVRLRLVESCKARDQQIWFAPPLALETKVFWPMVRAIKSKEGGCLGIVGMSIDAAPIYEQASNFWPKESSRFVAILGPDGTLWFRLPEIPSAIGQDLLSFSPILSLARRGGSGHEVIVSPIDHKKKLSVYRLSRDFGYVLMVNYGVDGLYASWWGQSILRVIIMIFAIFCLVLASLYLQYLLKGIKETEARLRREHLQSGQTAKVESFGRMASGIAHDFNNILTSILWSAEKYKSSTDLKPEAQQAVQQLNQAAESAMDINRQVLLQLTSVPSEPQIIWVKELLLDLAAFMQAIFSSEVDIEIEADGHLKIFADYAQVFQAFLQTCVQQAEHLKTAGGVLLLRAFAEPSTGFIQVEILSVSDAPDGREPYLGGDNGYLEQPLAAGVFSAFGGRITLAPYRLIVRLPLYNKEPEQVPSPS